MYIQLTNAHPDFLNEPIIINTANIVSIYTQTVAPSITVTCIHCPPHGTWNVQEDLYTVRATLDRVTASDLQQSVASTASIQEI
jgi:hypothetical protein